MLKKVKKEIKLCDVIYNNVPEMKQQIKEVEDKKINKIYNRVSGIYLLL